MKKRNTLLIALTALVLSLGSGCAVKRDQQTVGSYIDDAAITTKVKGKFVESKAVDATSISVETLKGTVMLSGFAKNSEEKTRAGQIARDIEGVTSVSNEIAVRP